MAGWFTHEWIANLVLKKLKIKQFISQFENIDDYFFGAIAPDIRYVANSPRGQTHKPYDEETLINALKASTTSAPFVAGYDIHLVTDMTWANEKGWLNESIYQHYNIDPNNSIQKFTLYGLVDDYFQAEADWFLPLAYSGNILRANDTTVLMKLGFDEATITSYKSIMAGYLREPGVDTINILNFIPSNMDEIVVKNFLDKNTQLTRFIQEFKKTAVEKSVEMLEKYL
ncbi:MAG: zinc dependent phospholipase C family protein [archaeon]